MKHLLAKLSSSIKTVSYTHLDVYKRQTIDNAGLHNANMSFDSCYPKGVQLVLPIGEEDAYYHLTDEEKQSIKNEYLNGDLSYLKAQFKSEIQSQLRELADKIPSKKAELEKMCIRDRFLLFHYFRLLYHIRDVEFLFLAS